jgi:prepilin-type processing-associated H-X9-DG protein
VELLVGTLIFSVLIALTLNGTRHLIQKGRVTQCLANLRQCGIAAMLYAGENRGRLPQSQHEGDSWISVTGQYLGSTRVIKSPLDPNKLRFFSYCINDYLLANPGGEEDEDDYNPMNDGPGFFLIQRIPKPSETVYLSLSQTNNLSSDHFHFYLSGYNAARFQNQVWTDVGDGYGHYLFVDGHAERRAWQDVRLDLTRRGSRFIRPDGHP